MLSCQVSLYSSPWGKVSLKKSLKLYENDVGGQCAWVNERQISVWSWVILPNWSDLEGVLSCVQAILFSIKQTLSVK
jgi:hypothetical protein